ncbi:MAG: glycosyltransferase family 39 protein, partial [Acidimicrobiia bacterium]|nr:glycosyltransferase family 39 protein [Acidimicrobiia bacterium]
MRLVVLVGVVAGIALRIRFLTGRAGVIDADEAIVGLLARHILRGEELVGFFWGQGYGGTLEPMLVAFVFALVGPRPGALAVVPTVLSAVAALLVWRIGRRTVGHRAAVVGALAMWLWPAYMVWFSTKEKGFYWVCLAVGLALLLVVLRLVEEPLRDGWWLLLGFLAGVGWWTSPQILYFVLPGVLWLLARQRQEAWRLVLAVPTALIGAAPWLVANFRDDWASFTPANRFNDQGFLGNVWVFLSEGVPVILNLRDAGGWIVDFFPVLYVALLAGIAVA